jgi:O-antigen ligase
VLASLRAARFPAESGLLLALAFFLPLAESPKNLLWLAYLFTWTVNRARARDFGGPWDLWDTLIGLWIASGFVVAAFAGLHKSEWQGAGDLLRYGSLLWLVKRGGYSARELKWLLGMLVASTVVGLAIGYFRLWTGIGKSGQLQLHSVGHVNHTAIYLAIVLGLCAAWVFARWNAWRPSRRTVALAVTLLVLVSLMVTASRGAIGAGLIAVLLISAGWWRAWRVPLVASAVAIGAFVAAALVVKPEVLQKHEENVAGQRVLSYRDGVWRMALGAWEKYPWFGVGMDNYSRITLERVREWRAEAGKPFDPADYYATSHGHSLFANTLAERGTAGSAALAAVLAAWFAGLLRRLPRREDGDFERLAWGAAAGAWLVTVIAGTVNTTLHHEHGILAALLLATWLSRSRTHRAS